MKETNPLRPLSPYAVSKVAQDLLAYQYFQELRPEDRPDARVQPHRAAAGRRLRHLEFRQADRRDREREERARSSHVGNLEAKRDFTDVRDIVRAYWLAAEKGEPGDVYNIGTGKADAMKDMLDMLLALSKVKVKVEGRSRPGCGPPTSPSCLSDSSKFVSLTRLEAPRSRSSRRSRTFLNYWRGKVGK